MTDGGGYPARVKLVRPDGVLVRPLLVTGSLLALSCAPAEPEPCGEADCLEQCPSMMPGSVLRTRTSRGRPGGEPVLSDAEWEIFAPELRDLRQGVRAWSEDSVGLCTGVSGCSSFVGLDAGVLPAGEYVVTAALRVPRLGDTNHWRGIFRRQCAFLMPDSKTVQRMEPLLSEHGFQFITDDKPFVLPELARATSPHPEFHVSCAWELEFHNPLAIDTISGSYEIPTAAELARAEAEAAEPGDAEGPTDTDVTLDGAGERQEGRPGDAGGGKTKPRPDKPLEDAPEPAGEAPSDDAPEPAGEAPSDDAPEDADEPGSP
jgi:hypothetical protein